MLPSPRSRVPARHIGESTPQIAWPEPLSESAAGRKGPDSHPLRKPGRLRQTRTCASLLQIRPSIPSTVIGAMMFLHRNRTSNAALACMSLALWLLVGRAVAQPTPEQQNAIRSNCRSDFMSNCSGVPRGGAEALQCLQRNLAKLSPACRTAVSVTMPRSAPAPAAAPVAAPAVSAPPPAATAPAAAASSPPAPPTAPVAAAPNVAPATAPTATPRQRTTAAPAPRAAAPAPAAKPPVQPSTSTVATPAVRPDPMTPLSVRARIEIARAYKGDQDAICRTVRPGGGHIIECLEKNAPALSAICKQALANARRSAR